MWRIVLIAAVCTLGGGLVAYLLLPIGAGAQVPQPPRVLDGRVVDTQVRPRRYKAEALRFRAIDESGYDWPGNDEVVVIIRVPAHNVLTASKEFANVDTGETYSFARNQSCILPIASQSGGTFNILRGDKGQTWTCSLAGSPGPFAFTVEMYEKDDGVLADCIRLEFGCEFSDGPYSGNDDLIGRRTVIYPLQDLVAVMPNVGDTFEESVRLGPCHEPEGCVITPLLPSGPDYKFTWRLTRLPDGGILDPTPSALPQATAQ